MVHAIVETDSPPGLLIIDDLAVGTAIYPKSVAAVGYGIGGGAIDCSVSPDRGDVVFLGTGAGEGVV